MLQSTKPSPRTYIFAVISFLILSALLAGCILVTQYTLVRDTLLEEKATNLTVISSSKQQELERYLKTIEQDLSLLSTAPWVKEAILDFSNSWDQLAKEEDNVSLYLQSEYIFQNPHLDGNKHFLLAAEGDALYHQTHKNYHEWFREFQDLKGYYDAFLFDAQGNLIYSVIKEVDYATNLANGPWSHTGLAHTFRRAARYTDEIAFTDLAPYAPSNDALASFIGKAVLDDAGELLGVVALQMPLKNITDTLSKYDGLGESGESYMIGSDFLMRSPSRFFENDSVLSQKVITEPAQRALDGKTGLITNTLDYRNIPVISAYTTITFHGVEWGLLTEQDYSEVMGSIHKTALKTSAIVTLLNLAWLLLGWLAVRTYMQKSKSTDS